MSRTKNAARRGPKRPRPESSKKRAGSDDESDNAGDNSSKRQKIDYVRPKGMQSDTEGNSYWELSQYRRVGISEFKGNTYANIREYYAKDGKMLPGKKGITLNADQLAVLVEVLPEIQKQFTAKTAAAAEDSDVVKEDEVDDMKDEQLKAEDKDGEPEAASD